MLFEHTTINENLGQTQLQLLVYIITLMKTFLTVVNKFDNVKTYGI